MFPEGLLHLKINPVSPLRNQHILFLYSEEFDIEIDAGYIVADNFRNKDAIIALVKRVLTERK